MQAKTTEIAIECGTRWVEFTTELNQMNRLLKIPPVQLVGHRPHQNRRAVTQALDHALGMRQLQLFGRQTEMVCRFGKKQKPHLIRRVIQCLIAGIIM